MDRMEIQEKVIDILAKHSDMDRSTLTPDRNLKLDLGLDSLDVAEIVFELEEAFGITIPEQSAERIARISDTVVFIQERMSAPEEDVSLQER